MASIRRIICFLIPQFRIYLRALLSLNSELVLIETTSIKQPKENLCFLEYTHINNIKFCWSDAQYQKSKFNTLNLEAPSWFQQSKTTFSFITPVAWSILGLVRCVQSLHQTVLKGPRRGVGVMGKCRTCLSQSKAIYLHRCDLFYFFSYSRWMQLPAAGSSKAKAGR